MTKPSVKTRCVANSYADKDERIIEFTGKAGGGLIAFRNTEGGGTTVDVYRTDPTVEVRTELHIALRAALRDVLAYNNRLNDPHGDGTGTDAHSPTGDSYNDLLSIIEPLFQVAGIDAP